jgi:hypothetical protein
LTDNQQTPQEKDPAFEEAAERIGLATLTDVAPAYSAQVKEMSKNLDHRAFGSGGKMLIGLYWCFVGLAEQVFKVDGRESVEDVLTEYETTQSRAPSGKTVATLTIFVTDEDGAERQIGLRGLYNSFSDFVRSPEISRAGYPSSPGHTTSRWHHNREDLRAIFGMTRAERRALAEEAWRLVLTLPRWKRRLPPRTVRDPFAQVLNDFDRHAKSGETSGASLQGLIYGYMVADAPSLQFRTAGARTGAKRAGLIGDIDGYDGPDLALTAEVKDRDLDEADEITDFYSNLTQWPDAIAFVACRSASESFTSEVEGFGIGVYTMGQLVNQVELWTVPKQLAAIRHAMGYFEFYEKKPDLADRFQAFLTERKVDLRG